MAGAGGGRSGREKSGGAHHAPEIRAAAMAALLAGQAVSEVAKEYRLPHGTVSRWRKAARAEAGRSEEIGALLLTYLRAGLATATKQLLVLGSPAYLIKQPAGEVAVLHGVLLDKLVRLLEAMDRPARA